MARTRVYNSNEISITFAGFSIDSGRAEGDFVTTKYDSETFTKKVGADGEVTRSKTNNTSGTATIKVMQTSDGHRILMQLDALGRASANGSDIAEFQIRDRLGGILEHADQAWIEKAPDSPNGKEAGEREWTLGLGELVREVE